MERCTCHHATGVVPTMRRAIRAALCVVFIGIFTSYVVRTMQNNSGEDSCYNLALELEALKREVGYKKANLGISRATNRPTDVKPGIANKDIRAIIREELEVYAADKTGLPDFAMENLGGCVLSVRNTPNLDTKRGSSILGLSFFNQKSNPAEIIRPSMAPGRCWAFRGDNGSAVIKLVGYVFISHISIEHISPLLSPTGDISSAPRNFSLWGLGDHDEQQHEFGRFEYKKYGPLVQIFQVPNVSSKSFKIIEVFFENNHGNKDFTCVYRVRIHGKLDDRNTMQS